MERFTTRKFLKYAIKGGIAIGTVATRAALGESGLAYAGSMSEVREQVLHQIIEIPYVPAKGQVMSLPWCPLDASLEGSVATGLNEGGPWDKYDALDREINENRARSIYWPQQGGFASTRDWLTYVALGSLLKNNYATRKSDGQCMDAVAGSFFGPAISGPISILGIDFTEWERKVIAANRWAGLARDPLNINDRQDIINRVNSGECVVAEVEPSWWAVIRDIQSNGTLVFTRYLRATKFGYEVGLQTEYRTFAQLRNAGVKVLYDNGIAEPDFEGSFVTVNRQIGGLILGTHQLIG